MAETAVNDAAQRYGVIEQAYSKEDWATVLRDGETLLQQLRQAGNPQFLGLRMRLQLLLGHTHLYGYADKGAASECYRAVAAQSSEASLAKIAEQGLNQCSVDETPAPEPEEASTAPTSMTAATPFTDPAPATLGTPSSTPATAANTSPAAPWLTAATPTSTPTPAPLAMDAAVAPTGGTQPVLMVGNPAAPWSEESLIPEVVEEPELIELHQADPTLAEEVELTWKEPAPTPATAPVSKDDEELLKGLLLVRIG